MKVRKAVFPVAGFGTRFLPATKAIPKEMLPILDRPLIQYAAEEAIAAGIETLVFVTSRLKRAIEDHFDYSPDLEQALRAKGKHELADQIQNTVPAHINCVFVRQHEQLGLGHAVLCAEPVIGPEPFAVLLPDDFLVPDAQSTTAELVAGYNESGKSQLSVMQVSGPDISKYGVVKLGADQRSVASLVEKPAFDQAPSDLASIGRYVLTPDIFNILRKQTPGAGGEIQLADAINTQAMHYAVEARTLTTTRYDCGSVEGYLAATMHVARMRSLL